MEFLHVSIAALASMILFLSLIVGYLYYQQSRVFQNMNAMAVVMGELAQQRLAPPPEPAPETPAEVVKDEEDDRVSVDDSPPRDRSPEVVDGPPAPLDMDGLDGKSKKELQDILTKRGLPYSKSDNKNALISLLKATA